MNKTITVVTPCFNEEDNILVLYTKVKNEFKKIPEYNYKHLFIDNSSIDNSKKILRELAKNDLNVQVIFNTRNFGAIRSPYYGLLQGKGDALIFMVCDLQDPPELIQTFIKCWENGDKVVIGVKNRTEEVGVMSYIRLFYYKLIDKISEIKLIKNFTGYGLYDRSIIDELLKIDSPYPYFRGLISEIGFSVREIPYYQPLRKNGISKYSIYNLYQVAMLGITSHSLVPLRVATFVGFFISILCLIISLGYLFLKILYWDRFPLGIATLLVALFFFASVQIFFIGILGEYIATILLQVKKRPLVFEEERINF